MTEGSASSSKVCRLCYQTDENDSFSTWIRPCDCRDLFEWAHLDCLQYEVNMTMIMWCLHCSKCYKFVPYIQVPVQKHCRLCFSFEQVSPWIRPCKCRFSMIDWVHTDCLKRWISLRMNRFRDLGRAGGNGYIKTVHQNDILRLGFCRFLKPFWTLDDGVRDCWLCYFTNELENDDLWTGFCRCKQWMKWCHKTCLQNWMESNRFRSGVVNCPICSTMFSVDPASLRLSIHLSRIDLMLMSFCPMLSAGLFVIMVHFGIVRPVALFLLGGKSETANLLEDFDPKYLLFSLLLAPTFIITRVYPWEERAVRWLLKLGSCLPLVQRFVCISAEDDRGLTARRSPFLYLLGDTVAHPTFSIVFGELVLKDLVKSPVQRTLLCATTVIAIRSIRRL